MIINNIPSGVNFKKLGIAAGSGSSASGASGLPKQAPSICEEPRSCIATEVSIAERERVEDP